jgi:uncharacterized protein with ATP-grasp and redox domains
VKARFSCVPCFVKQAMNAIRLSTEDPAVQQRAMDLVLLRLRGIDLSQSPALLSNIVYEAAREVTGVRDPFAQAKRETNAAALALLPALRRKIDSAADPLHTAIKAALSGNIIDLGIGHKFDIARDVERMMDAELTIDDYAAFLGALGGARRLLYCCDNSGEIAFDCLLIERLRERCAVTATVKSLPIINDATMEDAEAVGLTRLIPVIETGTDYIGVHWERSSAEFRRAFLEADLIIAKGQGNFETLNTRREEIFFLLKAKCAEVASELGVAEGSTVFLRNRARGG